MSEQQSLFGKKLHADLEIEDELWEAAEDLRGTVAPADYKHYVLPLLFLRYLSLRYEERRDELEAKVNDPESFYVTDDLDDPNEYRSEGAFYIPEKARWSYLVEHAQEDDIKVKVDRAMELLEERYDELDGVLPPIYAGSNLSRENLTNLINLFSRDIFTGQGKQQADVLGRVYEYFITNFADTEGNRGGEFFTPRSVVQTLVAMLEPEDGSKIFDPACGSGGMFVQAAEFTDDRESLSFYGQESIDQTLRLCKMNLLMHDLQGDLKLGNSLLNDQHEGLEADYVIANPPFNVRSWGADEVPGDDPRLQVGDRRLQPTDSNANYFWMMHFLHHLGENGTAGYVMANGSMTTSLANEEETRKALVDEGFVDCIVQMPDKLFFGTGIPACLWFLSKSRDGSNGEAERDDEILFLDARDMGEKVERTKRVLDEEEIGRLETVYHRFRAPDESVEETPGFSATASLDEVQSNDYKLTPGLYVGFAEDDGDRVPFEIKMPQLVDELEDQFAESERLQSKIRSNLRTLAGEEMDALPANGDSA
jgi:type I restriction enzyme M protein